MANSKTEVQRLSLIFFGFLGGKARIHRKIRSSRSAKVNLLRTRRRNKNACCLRRNKKHKKKLNISIQTDRRVEKQSERGTSDHGFSICMIESSKIKLGQGSYELSNNFEHLEP